MYVSVTNPNNNNTATAKTNRGAGAGSSNSSNGGARSSHAVFAHGPRVPLIQHIHQLCIILHKATLFYLKHNEPRIQQ